MKQKEETPSKRVPMVEYNISEMVKNIKERMNVPNIPFKPKKYIPISEAFTNATNLIGLESGAVHGFAGKSNSGKSTAAAHAMINCIKMGIIPVYFDLEQKMKWSRMRKMGLDFKMVKINSYGESIEEGQEGFEEFDGSIEYIGDFYYVTPNMLINKYQANDNIGVVSTEDVSSFFNDIYEQQKKTGASFAFFIDSIPHLLPKSYLKAAISKDGSYVDSDQLKTNNLQKTQQNNNMINFIIQKIIKRSLYNDVPYYNWLFMIYNVHEKQSMSISTVKVAGGEKAKYFLDTLFYFGGKGGEAGRAIKATKTTNKITKDYKAGVLVKIDVEKGHIDDIENRNKRGTSLTTNGELLITPHGFVGNSKSDINEYKKNYPEEFVGVEFVDDSEEEKNETDISEE